MLKATHSNVCMGCLSSDRRLKIMNNHEDEIKKMYCSIIDEKLQIPGPLALCWECIANISRYKSFRRQCLQAHTILIKQMQTPTNIASLSKLITVRNNIIININHMCDETQNTELNMSNKCQGISHKYHNYGDSQSESNDIKYQNTLNYKVCKTTEEYGKVSLSTEEYHNGITKTSEEYHIGVSSEKSRTCDPPTLEGDRDLHFIKVEEDGALVDIEGCYGDDGFDHQSDMDDKNFDLVLDSCIDEKIDVKRQRKKENKSECEFDDSDEEPLNNKRRRKKVKERKRKKREENEEPIKSNVGGKREKPAGVVWNPRVMKKLQQLNVSEGQLEMVVLTWDEVEEERQKALSSIVFTRHEYRCHDCILGFNHKFKLDNHMKKHEPCSGEAVCSVCKVRCRDAHALCAHRRRHRVRWRCCQCGETASRAAVAADHVAREHLAPPPTHTCTVCGHAEPTLGKLRNHIKNHAERQKCELCGKSFRDRTSLRTHLFIHKGEKEYGCPRCGKRFLFKKAMEVHLVTHDAPAHLYCHLCDMNFKNRMSYTQHMKYSLKHIDPAKLKHACGECGKRFAQAARLHEHHVAVHLRATPVRCTAPGCHFACSSRPVLRTHTRMVHRNARAQRNHVCHTCGKAYTTKKTLEGHMRSHTGERPFACSLCPSTFGYEAALYNHNKLVHLKAKTKRPPQPAVQIPQPPLDLDV